MGEILDADYKNDNKGFFGKFLIVGFILMVFMVSVGSDPIQIQGFFNPNKFTPISIDIPKKFTKFYILNNRYSDTIKQLYIIPDTGIFVKTDISNITTGESRVIEILNNNTYSVNILLSPVKNPDMTIANVVQFIKLWSIPVLGFLSIWWILTHWDTLDRISRPEIWR